MELDTDEELASAASKPASLSSQKQKSGVSPSGYGSLTFQPSGLSAAGGSTHHKSPTPTHSQRSESAESGIRRTPSEDSSSRRLKEGIAPPAGALRIFRTPPPPPPDRSPPKDYRFLMLDSDEDFRSGPFRSSIDHGAGGASGKRGRGHIPQHPLEPTAEEVAARMEAAKRSKTPEAHLKSIKEALGVEGGGSRSPQRSPRGSVLHIETPLGRAQSPTISSRLKERSHRRSSRGRSPVLSVSTRRNLNAVSNPALLRQNRHHEGRLKTQERLKAIREAEKRREAELAADFEIRVRQNSELRKMEAHWHEQQAAQRGLSPRVERAARSVPQTVALEGTGDRTLKSSGSGGSSGVKRWDPTQYSYQKVVVFHDDSDEERERRGSAWRESSTRSARSASLARQMVAEAIERRMHQDDGSDPYAIPAADSERYLDADGNFVTSESDGVFHRDSEVGERSTQQQEIQPQPSALAIHCSLVPRLPDAIDVPPAVSQRLSAMAQKHQTLRSPQPKGELSDKPTSALKLTGTNKNSAAKEAIEVPPFMANLLRSPTPKKPYPGNGGDMNLLAAPMLVQLQPGPHSGSSIVLSGNGETTSQLQKLSLSSPSPPNLTSSPASLLRLPNAFSPPPSTISGTGSLYGKAILPVESSPKPTERTTDATGTVPIELNALFGTSIKSAKKFVERGPLETPLNLL